MSDVNRTNVRQANTRRGFSFIEILFAVMILGIGFILIAGVFPVAISQTAATHDETVAATLVRGSIAAVTTIPGIQTTITFPANGKVIRLTDTMWAAVKGNVIYKDDPRFAWVAMLKRDVADPVTQRVPNTAQLIVVPVQVQGRSGFEQPAVDKGERDLQQSNNTGDNAFGNLMPWPVKVKLHEGSKIGPTNPDYVELTGVGGTIGDRGLGAAVPGAVLVIAEAGKVDENGRLVAGRAYRLGESLGGNSYNLLPGNDMSVDNGNSQEVSGAPIAAYLVGQGLSPAGLATVPIGGVSAFEGGNMALGVYSTYISLK